MTPQERVQAGALYLDCEFDRWQKLINLNRLDMHGRSACILGQVYGDYNKAIEELGLSDEECVDYGFINIRDSKCDGFADDIVNLEDAWTEYIIQWRKENGGSRDISFHLVIDGKSVVPTADFLRSFAELL
jgi:hypothetical protein